MAVDAGGSRIWARPCGLADGRPGAGGDLAPAGNLANRRRTQSAATRRRVGWSAPWRGPPIGELRALGLAAAKMELAGPVFRRLLPAGQWAVYRRWLLGRDWRRRRFAAARCSALVAVAVWSGHCTGGPGSVEWNRPALRPRA